MRERYWAERFPVHLAPERLGWLHDITTSYVLAEALALLQHRFGLRAVDDFQDAVAPLLATVWVDSELHAEGVAGLLTARRRGLSLVDCASFACMRRQEIARAFHIDRHFAEPGDGNDASNVRLVHNSERFAVARAAAGAARTLGNLECQALLDEFADSSGRPLRAALDASGLDAPEYLDGVLFYDAPASLCAASALAVTVPGSRVVLVCGSRFVRQMERSSLHAEAILIHETLHSLGLGENPPSSDYITKRIRARCE